MEDIHLIQLIWKTLASHEIQRNSEICFFTKQGHWIVSTYIEKAFGGSSNGQYEQEEWLQCFNVHMGTWLEFKDQLEKLWSYPLICWLNEGFCPFSMLCQEVPEEFFFSVNIWMKMLIKGISVYLWKRVLIHRQALNCS